VCVCVVQVRTVADTDNLALASLPRPGEMCRGSPRARSRVVPVPILCPRLGGGGTRSSETVSPERDPSAWARGWARQGVVWTLVYSWMIDVGLSMSVMMRNMYILKY